MKLALRKTVSVSEQRRNNLLLERQQAVAVRDLYPSLGHLRVSLVFDGGGPRQPSPQTHTFFPAARAFFRFACPCADCDGDFDLREPVGVLLAGMSQVRALNGGGRLSCDGVRLRDRVDCQPCTMKLEYQLTAATAD